MWLIFWEKQPAVVINPSEPSVQNSSSRLNRGNYCAMEDHRDIARFLQTWKCRALNTIERGQEHNGGAESTMRTKKDSVPAEMSNGITS
jgi:hypothetical protein